jgi:beta-1,4-mannosyltransferase
MSGEGERPLRVLAQPAFRNRHANPYQWLLNRELCALGIDVEEFSLAALRTNPPDVCHLHWPEYVGVGGRGALRLLRALDLARANGTRVVWTVHNLHGHDRRVTERNRWHWRRFTRRVDGWISLSESGRGLAIERLPDLRRVRSAVIPHGHYRGAYPDRLTRSDARARLAIDERASVLAHVGQLRPYKDVPSLVDAFRRHPDPSAVLVVAGQPSSESMARMLLHAVAADARIRVAPGFVPDDDLQLYLRAADAVILPYRDVLNSGSALLALSFDCPVVAPATAPLLELRDEVGPEWLFAYEGEIDASRIADAARWAHESQRTSPDLRRREWKQIASRTVDLYEMVLAGGAVTSEAVP